MNEVIKSKFVKRDQNGYIVEVELNTNKRRSYCFRGRSFALWANSHYQPLQALNPRDIAVAHTVELR